MAIRQPRKAWGQMVYLAVSKKKSDPMVMIFNHVDTWLEEICGAVELLFEVRREKAS